MLSPCCNAESRYVRGEDAEPSARVRNMGLPIKDASVYIRRRECLRCSRRFNTLEMVTHIDRTIVGTGQLRFSFPN